MNKNILVSSRQGIRNVLSKVAAATIVISIHDPDLKPEFSMEETLPFVCAILSIPFWDEIEDQYGCISEIQAQGIAEFVVAFAPFVENIVVNCEGGISRSAGVAAAIAKFINKDDSAFFDFRHNRYVPNMTCYKRVLEQLSGFVVKR